MGIYKIKIADCDLSAEYSIHEGMASIDGMTPDDSDETVIDSLILSKKDDNGNEIFSDKIGLLIAQNLSNKYENIYGTFGIHPHETKDFINIDAEYILNIIKNNNKIIGIGETGLDYYYNHSDKVTQKKSFLAKIFSLSTFFTQIKNQTLRFPLDVCM